MPFLLSLVPLELWLESPAKLQIETEVPVHDQDDRRFYGTFVPQLCPCRHGIAGDIREMGLSQVQPLENDEAAGGQRLKSLRCNENWLRGLDLTPRFEL